VCEEEEEEEITKTRQQLIEQEKETREFLF